ncbi:MAG: YceD family protein [Nitrospinota bacterium]
MMTEILTRIVDVKLLDEKGLEGSFQLSDDELDDEIRNLLSSVVVEGRLYRVGETIKFSGITTADVLLSCARCLKEIKRGIKENVESTYLAASSIEGKKHLSIAEVELTADEMDIELYDGNSIDIFRSIRDYLLLAIPLNYICSENCKGLCSKCGIDKNSSECDCSETNIDPRLAKLLDIKFKK